MSFIFKIGVFKIGLLYQKGVKHSHILWLRWAFLKSSSLSRKAKPVALHLDKDRPFPDWPILPKNQRLYLYFCPEVGIFETGLFYWKSKAYSLTFCLRIGLFENGPSYKKGKACSLAFCPRISIVKTGLFPEQQSG